MFNRKPSIDLTTTWVEVAKVNLYDDDKAMLVELQVPGFQKEELSINVEDGILLVTGTPNSETVKKASHQEFIKETFERKFKLPELCDERSVVATCNMGILHIAFGKKDKSAKTIISID